MTEKTRQVVFLVVEAELRGSQRWDDWVSLSEARKEVYGRREGLSETSKQQNIATFYYGVSRFLAAVMSFILKSARLLSDSSRWILRIMYSLIAYSMERREG